MVKNALPLGGRDREEEALASLIGRAVPPTGMPPWMFKNTQGMHCEPYDTLSSVPLKLPDREWTQAGLEHYTPCGVIEF